MALALTIQGDSAVVTGLSNQSSGSFFLVGGAYAFTAVGGAGNIVLQQLGPDGSTWLNSFTALTATGVQSPLYLPPGTFRFSGTNTNASAAIQRVRLF